MLLHFLILFCSFLITDETHFDGGTITWAPINPYTNFSSVDITITQSYAWYYPTITCATNVPITTSGRSTQNWNLTCVVDCTTDGGYSTKPIDILTDCTTVSTSLGMMNSVRLHNLTLTAGAHFYLANVGSAWVALNYPTQSGLEWSIVTSIDLRMRPDGFINTAPVASVVSPQYAIVNKTMQINIPVSDVNAGDDVRCRWSTYTAGYRRRKRSDEEERIAYQSITHFYQKLAQDEEIIHIRKKRSCSSNGCLTTCPNNCWCGCNGCYNTTCTGTTCSDSPACDPITIPTVATTTKTTTTTIATTTTETEGILKSTSSYPHRQAIDECGGICYPGSLPNGTTLSNCTLTFTGLKAGVWYAVAIQVEDFINKTSTTAMSSVPAQLLIYVMPDPACSKPPIIFPLNRCLEVQVGVTISFDLYAMNLCNKTISTITDIVVSSGIIGMTASNLTDSPTNSSLSYVTFTWIPQANQIGLQELCTIAFTSEKVQSDQYCITFTVKNSSNVCVTTTTTSTSTTTKTTTSTSATTVTTSSITTSKTSTTASTTTASSTTLTSTTSITTSTTSSSTSISATTSTSTTSTTASTTSILTSTTTTSISITTSTSTTATTTTATTATATTIAPEQSTNSALIVGLSVLILLLVLCCSCSWLCWFLWGPSARRRRQRKEEDDRGQQTILPRNIAGLTRKTRGISRIYQPRNSRKDHLVDHIPHAKDPIRRNSPQDMHINLSESTTIMADVHAKPTNHRNDNESTSAIQRSAVTVLRMNKVANMDKTNKLNSNAAQQKTVNTTSTIPSKPVQVNVNKIRRNDLANNQGPSAARGGNLSITQLDKSSIEMRPITNHS